MKYLSQHTNINVMKIKTILLLLGSVWSLCLEAQTTKAIKATVLSATCRGTCNGRIKIDIGTGTVVPLTITVSDGRAGNSRVFNNVIRSFEVNELCAGKWVVSATPDKVESCTPVSEEITIPVVDFKIRTLAINNPSATGQNNGSISVQGYAQTNDGLIHEHYTYTYQWSNGSTSSQLAQVGAGNYGLTLTNTQTGCRTTGSFSLGSNCGSAANFEVRIQGGIASAERRNNIPMTAYIRTNSDAPWVPVPEGYVIEWTYGNQRINARSITVPMNLAPIDVKVKVTNACGQSQEAQRRAVTCDGAEVEAKNYFLSRLIAPCIGHSDGGATLEFSTTEGEFARLELSDGVSTEVIFDPSIGIGADAVGADFRIELPSLRGGKTYTITGILGYDCEVSFSFELQEKDTEKLCSGYDKKKNLCLYNEKCNGEDVGPKSNYKVPAFSDKTAWETGENGKILPACREDLFCLCNGNNIRVERGKEAWETVRVGQYVGILNDYLRQTGIEAPLARAAAEGHDPCGHVKYCKLDPTITGIPGFFNFAEKFKPPFKVLSDGCREFTCKAAIVFKNKFKACNLPRDYDPKPKGEGSRSCDVRNENLLQMIIWHKRGLLRALWPGPDRAQKYQGSRLEAFLNQYNDMNYKALRCARVEFCKNDLNLEPKTDISNALCGISLQVNNGQPAISCDIASLKLEEGLLRYSPIIGQQSGKK
jgi:hypothetical protein